LSSSKGGAVFVPKPAILVLLTGGLLSPSCAAEDDLPRGQIAERVVCRADAGQTYALYLPSSYSPARLWPILYCFDPGARGRLPVELFRAAAERYGYILAGSNNSRNGPQGQSVEAMKAMWEDTQGRFPLDPSRVFIAGMSGGARVACIFAQGSPLFAGVIAFAAGFPNARAPARVPYFFFGAAGRDDFNYPEMRQLDSDLEKLGAIHRIATFDGGHGWPTVEICTQGIEWLELQSMKAGKRPRDGALIDALYEKAAASTRAAENAGNTGEFYLQERAIAEDFRGLKDVTVFESSAARLAGSKEIRKFLQDEKGQQAIQNSRQAGLFAQWNRRYEGDESADAGITFNFVLSELKKQAEAPSDSPARRISRRVLEGSYIQSIEESRGLVGSQNYLSAARLMELAAAIHPDRPQLLYNLATVYAKGRDRRGAIDALKRAVEQGFRDSRAFEHEEAFEFLRNDPAIKLLLEKIQKPQ
jgi:dienelactone hydrolase